jgi:hypothetical protein
MVVEVVFAASDELSKKGVVPMKCERLSCSCMVEPKRAFELQGKTYCSKTCAEVCTDEKCECTPCECPK